MSDLINGRTLEQIKEAASICVSSDTCQMYKCPYEVLNDCRERMTEDLLSLVHRLEEAQPKWISVKERLPENGELVLVTMNGEIHGAKLFNRAYELACYYRDGEDEEGEYHIDGWELWDYRDGEVSALEVFYWMPLPKEPGEEG